MGLRRNVTVLYGEGKLQKTISIPAFATVAQTKKYGSDEILNHLRLQAGVPQDISIDQETTDFYPAASDNTSIQDLDGQITVVVWPESTPEDPYTPSPIMDTLAKKTAELADTRSKLSAGALIKEADKSKRPQKSKPGPSSSSLNTTSNYDSTISMILSRLTALEDSSAELQRSQAELQRSQAELQRSQAELQRNDTELWRNNTELEATLQITMEAVLGDPVAINKLRNRVLLGTGRNQLAVFCGHQDWGAWKASSASRDEIFNAALTQLRAPSDDLPQGWLALSNQPMALRMLLFPDQVQDRGDIAAHSSVKRSIGEGVLALTMDEERADMAAIFKAVYGEEPAH